MNVVPYKLIIIGSGPAGLTAAIYAARAHLKPVVIEGKTPGGQLIKTTFVENWPGEKSILGPDLMKNLKDHAAHFGTQFLSGEIEKVNFSCHPFQLWGSNDQIFHAESVIIATGSLPIKLKCPGEEEYWGKGVSICAICDGFFYKDKRVMIVGGGNSAMEEALFLQKYTKHITIIQLKDRLTATPALISRVQQNPDLKIIYQSTVIKIEGDGHQVTQVEVQDNQRNRTYTLPVDGLFIAIGLTPNTHIFKEQLELDAHGYIILKNGVQTSKKGVFAAGDVFDGRYRQAITASGSGCMAALEAERYLSEYK